MNGYINLPSRLLAKFFENQSTNFHLDGIYSEMLDVINSNKPIFVDRVETLVEGVTYLLISCSFVNAGILRERTGDIKLRIPIETGVVSNIKVTITNSDEVTVLME